jgi:hypothetical protein
MTRRPIDWTSMVVAITPFLGTIFAFAFIAVMVLR